MMGYLWKIVLACLIVLLIVGVGGYIVWHISGEPVEVVNAHLKALREGNIETAYSYLSQAFRQEKSLGDFREWVRTQPALAKAKEFTSYDRRFTGDGTQLNGSVVGIDESKQPAKYHLIKENGNWRIQRIEMERSGFMTPAAAAAAPMPEPPVTFAIQDLELQKRSSANTVKIEITFRVVGFRFGADPHRPRMHLSQDLQTFSSAGQIVPELSRKRMKELAEDQLYTVANFSNDLTLPGKAYPKGKYRMRIVVHDLIGKQSTEAWTVFEL